jgi:anti-sigma factor RsiW
MTHEEIRELIHPYADGELDVANAREVEQHLTVCADCRRLERRVHLLRGALRKSAPAYRAPARLRKNVRRAVRKEAGAGHETSSPWLLLATGAAFAILLLSFAFYQTTSASRNALADELVADHVRSLLAAHLVDVVSSDQHTVKPWFDGKVDFAPEVRDLAAYGFPLVGGRLDYLHGRTVVALVYRRQKHPINVFVEPASTSGDAKPSTSTHRGYNLVHWRRDGMNYWAISDLNATELEQFVTHFTS